MDCITIDAPYAYLLAYGVKDVEVRSWLPGTLPRRLYIHTTKMSGCPWIVKEDLPTGCFEAYNAWRDENGPEEWWMSPLQRLITAELKHYGVSDLMDVDFDKIVKNTHKYFLLSSAIIGWIDIDHAEGTGMWAEKGKKNWHIAGCGLLEQPITQVIGKQRIWRYENG